MTFNLWDQIWHIRPVQQDPMLRFYGRIVDLFSSCVCMCICTKCLCMCWNLNQFKIWLRRRASQNDHINTNSKRLNYECYDVMFSMDLMGWILTMSRTHLKNRLRKVISSSNWSSKSHFQVWLINLYIKAQEFVYL